MKETQISAKSKMKRMLKDNLAGIVIALIFIAVVLAVVIIIRNNVNEPTAPEIKRPSALYEITETDIFALKEFTSNQVSVLGIMLGDTQAHVLDTLGSPDNRRDYPSDGIINLEYSKNIGLNETGLIVHIKNGNVARISMLQPFEEKLIGKTKVSYNKTDLYNLLGAPDDMQFIPVSPGSALVYRLLSYKNNGIEVTMRKSVQNGLNLVPHS